MDITTDPTLKRLEVDLADKMLLADVYEVFPEAKPDPELTRAREMKNLIREIYGMPVKNYDAK